MNIKLNIKNCIFLILSVSMMGFADDMSNIRNREGTGFGSEAANYSKGRKAYPKELFDWIKQFVKEDADLLDIGCGNGRTTLALKEQVATKVTGFDIDSAMLIEASKMAKSYGLDIPFVQGDVKDLAQKFPKDHFDIITAGASLHWFSKPEDFQAIRSVLKPEGLFIVIGGRGNSKKERKEEKVTNSVIFEILGYKLPSNVKIDEGLLEKNGFTILKKKQITMDEVYTLEEAMADAMSRSSYAERTQTEKDLLRPALEQMLRSKLHEGVIHKSATYTCIICRVTS